MSDEGLIARYNQLVKEESERRERVIRMEAEIDRDKKAMMEVASNLNEMGFATLTVAEARVAELEIEITKALAEAEELLV